jgi:multidrug efflux pump subunit AcrB
MEQEIEKDQDTVVKDGKSVTIVVSRVVFPGHENDYDAWVTKLADAAKQSPGNTGVTILISAVVSLTLTPMMCARILKHTPEERQGRFFRASQRVFDRIIQSYGKTLRWVLGHQKPTLVVVILTLFLTVLLYIIVPKGFFPIQDTGVILGISEAPQSISFLGMAKQQQALSRVILKDPAVESLSSFIGVDGTNTTLNSGRILINLKPLEERKINASEIIRRLQKKLEKVLLAKQKVFEREKAILRKEKSTIERDFAKKLASETNRILKAERARQQEDQKRLREQFERTAMQKFDKEKQKTYSDSRT